MLYSLNVASSRIPVVAKLRLQNENFLDKRDRPIGTCGIEYMREKWSIDGHFRCHFNISHFRHGRRYYKGRHVTFREQDDKSRFKWHKFTPKSQQPNIK